MQRTDRAGAAAWCVLVVALATLGTQARAEVDAPERPALGLAEALERAFGHNKDLAAFAYRTAEQQGRLEQAGLLPNPRVELTVEDAAGSGIYEGFDAAQTTLSLGWVLEGRLRRERVRAAGAGSALLAADAEILRLEVAADTADHFLESLASQVRLERAEAAIALAERTVDAVTRRARAGNCLLYTSPSPRDRS